MTTPSLYHRYIARCRQWSWNEARAVRFSGLVMAVIGACLLCATGMPLASRLVGIPINLVGVLGVWSGMQVVFEPRPVPRPPRDDRKEPCQPAEQETAPPRGEENDHE